MAWLLFIDESGHDRAASPYEVLAGVAIRDRTVREVIERLHEAEDRHFGRRYSDGHRELKGKLLLKRKVFRHRDRRDIEVDPASVPALARAALDDGARAGPQTLKALALAKLDCRAFASIVENDARPTAGATGFTHLRPVALHCTSSIRRPGPRAGAQPRFSPQPRRLAPLSAAGGIGSQGWTPARRPG